MSHHTEKQSGLNSGSSVTDEEYALCEYCNGVHAKDPWVEQDPFLKRKREDQHSEPACKRAWVDDAEDDEKKKKQHGSK